MNQIVAANEHYVLLLVEFSGVTNQKTTLCRNPIPRLTAEVMMFPRTIVNELIDMSENINVIDMLLLIEGCNVTGKAAFQLGGRSARSGIRI